MRQQLLREEVEGERVLANVFLSAGRRDAGGREEKDMWIAVIPLLLSLPLFLYHQGLVVVAAPASANDMCLFREHSVCILQSRGSAAINAVNCIIYVSYYNYPVFV